jgi:uncharacterized short protein YbdD (DUF466 family)
MLGKQTDVARSAAKRRGPGLVVKLLGSLRSMAGMPDYDRHLEHLRRCHPELPVPTQRQFYDDFVKNRYGDGPTRCC